MSPSPPGPPTGGGDASPFTPPRVPAPDLDEEPVWEPLKKKKKKGKGKGGKKGKGKGGKGKDNIMRWDNRAKRWVMYRPKAIRDRAPPTRTTPIEVDDGEKPEPSKKRKPVHAGNWDEPTRKKLRTECVSKNHCMNEHGIGNPAGCDKADCKFSHDCFLCGKSHRIKDCPEFKSKVAKLT